MSRRQELLVLDIPNRAGIHATRTLGTLARKIQVKGKALFADISETLASSFTSAKRASRQSEICFRVVSLRKICVATLAPKSPTL